MNYTLNQLRIFLKVAETLSMTKAAEELHLTQPAVSIQLKNFQDQFELPLIEIISKKIYLTEFGKEIVKSAELIMAEVHGIQYRMHAHKGQISGKLRLSIVSTGKYIAPYFLTGFVKHYPDIELCLDVTNKAQVISSLEKNEVDFALVSILPEQLKIEKIDLMQNKLFLVGNGETKFNRKEIDKKTLNSIPMIYREAGSGTRHAMEKYLRINAIPGQKKLELTGNEAVKQALIAGLGYSIMPLIGIRNELENNQLQIIPVKGLPIKSTWSLIWIKGKKHAPLAEAFKAYLKKEKQNIIHEKFDWFEKY